MEARQGGKGREMAAGREKGSVLERDKEAEMSEQELGAGLKLEEPRMPLCECFISTMNLSW